MLESNHYSFGILFLAVILSQATAGSKYAISAYMHLTSDVANNVIMILSVQQLTSGASIDDVLVVPAHMTGLVVADDILMREAQVRLAGARVAEAARAQHDAR